MWPAEVSDTCDYLQYKDLMVHLGMLTVEQATSETKESTLLYDCWFSISQVRLNSDKLQLKDLKVFLLAVMRLNDGKSFNCQSPNPKDKVFGSLSTENTLEMH